MHPEVVLKAMVDGTRRRTLSVLRREELNVSELVEVLHQPQSTVSRHLRVLKEAALIQDRRDGNTVLYSVPVVLSGQDELDLSARLLDWIEQQALPPTIEARLASVVEKRSDMSVRFFDRIGRQWDTLREDSFGSSFHLEAFISLLPRRWTVADIGTGTGFLLPTLSRHFERVIGVEPVGRMLETARRRVEHHRLENTDLLEGALGNLPIDDDSVDLAVAVLVLHHVGAPRKAVAELARIVRPGGHVLVVEQMAHRMEPFRERMQDRWWGFEPRDLASMLQSSGMERPETHPLASVVRSADAPDLFVATASKPNRERKDRTKRHAGA